MEDSQDLLQLIGGRVGERRAALGLSLDETAARTGVSLSALFAREAVAPLLRHAEQPLWQDPETGYVRREVAPAGTGSPVRIVEIAFPAGAEIAFGRNPRRVID